MATQGPKGTPVKVVPKSGKGGFPVTVTNPEDFDIPDLVDVSAANVSLNTPGYEEYDTVQKGINTIADRLSGKLNIEDYKLINANDMGILLDRQPIWYDYTTEEFSSFPLLRDRTASITKEAIAISDNDISQSLTQNEQTIIPMLAIGYVGNNANSSFSLVDGGLQVNDDSRFRTIKYAIGIANSSAFTYKIELLDQDDNVKDSFIANVQASVDFLDTRYFQYISSNDVDVYRLAITELSGAYTNGYVTIKQNVTGISAGIYDTESKELRPEALPRRPFENIVVTDSLVLTESEQDYLTFSAFDVGPARIWANDLTGVLTLSRTGGTQLGVLTISVYVGAVQILSIPNSYTSNKDGELFNIGNKSIVDTFDSSSPITVKLSYAGAGTMTVSGCRASLKVESI